MKFVRVRFTIEEFESMKKYADINNRSVNQHIKDVVLKENKGLHLYYLLNNTLIILEELVNLLEDRTYCTNDIKFFSKLQSIEQMMLEVLHDNHRK